MKFEEILTEYHIPFKTEGNHCRNGWINFDCPFCSKDQEHYRMGFNIEGKYVHCWLCGKHGLVHTLSEITDISYSKCKKLLDDIITKRIVKEKHKGKLILPSRIGELQTAHRNYLRGRGFNPTTLQKTWGIKGFGAVGKYSWRIFIPITFEGKIISWTTRSISNNKNITRYITAKEEHSAMPIKSILYGEEFVKHVIFINEGPTDAWNIGKGAVATLGTAYSQAQVNKMAQYPTRVICFDNEREAQKRAQKLCNDLSVFPGDTYNIILDAKDPGSASKKEINRLRREFLK